MVNEYSVDDEEAWPEEIEMLKKIKSGEIVMEKVSLEELLEEINTSDEELIPVEIPEEDAERFTRETIKKNKELFDRLANEEDA